VTCGRICVREVHLARADESIRDAARRMDEEGVGALFVLDPERRPRGVLTDRDIAVRCVASERDPIHTPVAALMTKPVVTISESSSIEDALAKMASHRIRRIAVVEEDGALAGVLALDDVLDLLAEENTIIGRLLQSRN
jgi:CBS domain-containing protein